MGEALIFYTVSALAIAAGVCVVTMKNPISSAVALVSSFFCLAVLYALLGAHFVAVVQVLVYAGAIMVLFIFVIMLLNLREESEQAWGDMNARAVAGMCVAALLGGGLLVSLASAQSTHFLPADLAPENFGTIKSVGYALFSGRYLLPFEAVSALLTVGVVGAVVLAKRQL
jgi:NADH-quinone oxidoreductase subunit J